MYAPRRKGEKVKLTMDTRTYPARGGARAAIVLGALAAAWSVVAGGAVPALAQDPSPPAARAVPTLPADPETGKAYPLRINDANRRVRLIVDSAARIDEYGTHKPADGRALLVVSTEWENTIPLTSVDRKSVV